MITTHRKWGEGSIGVPSGRRVGTRQFTPRGRNIYISVGILFILLPTRSGERGVCGCPQVGGLAPGTSHLGGGYIYISVGILLFYYPPELERGVLGCPQVGGSAPDTSHLGGAGNIP